jgi:FtsP/CotA-like multicopper oxidase with cupredoxin domain
LFGAYLLRDSAEEALNLPRGGYEIPLWLCDRLLRQGPRPPTDSCSCLSIIKDVEFPWTSHAPAAHEAGWKDTVRVESRGVTRIIVRFDGYPGRFVWHCHTLEHAANEMMRPYDIISG